MLVRQTYSENHAIKASKGFYVTEKTPIFYEASIPLTYSIELPHMPEVAFKINCTNKQTCPLIKNLDMLQRLSALKMNELLPLREEHVQVSKKRNKRGLNFIATMENWCCGVATQQSVNDIYASENKMQAYMTQIEEQVARDHASALSTTKTLNDYSKKIVTYYK